MKTVEGFSQYSSYFDLFTDFMNLLPGDEDYILSQYDLLGNSHFPQNENEILLVVGSDTTLTDLVFGQLGYYDGESFLNICEKSVFKHNNPGVMTDEELDAKYPYETSFTFDDLLKKKFYYYPHDTIYRYDDIPVRPYKDYSIVLRNSTNDEFYSLTYSSNMSRTLVNGIIYTGTHIKLNPFSYENIYAIKMKDGFNPMDMGGKDIQELIANPDTDTDPSSGTFITFNSSDARAIISGASTSSLTSLSLLNIGEGNPTTARVNYMSQFECNKEITD